MQRKPSSTLSSSGQAEILQYHRGFRAAHLGQRGFAIACLQDPISLEVPAQLALQSLVVVLDDKQRACGFVLAQRIGG